MRTALEVADVFRRHGAAYRVEHTATLEATVDLMRDVAAAGEEFFAEGRQS